MQGNNRQTEYGASGIIQPRFPRLKNKSQFEIIQYQIGRKEMAQRLEVFYESFKDYLDIIEKPIIRKTTEPFEIFEYYYEVVNDLCKSYDIQHDLIDYILGKKKTNTNFITGELCDFPVYSKQFDVDQFYGFGIGWTSQLNQNYRNWFLYIFNFLRIDFCVDTIWEILEKFTDYIEYDDSYLENELRISDPEEYEQAKARSVEIAKMKERENAKNPFGKNHPKPKRLWAPKSEFEKTVHDCILKGIEFIDNCDKKTIFDFFDQQESEYDGCLQLNTLYLICDSWLQCETDVEYYIFEQHIDEQANNVGITPYRINSPVFDPEEFDFTPINLLNNFHASFSSIEAQIRNNNGRIPTTK